MGQEITNSSFSEQQYRDFSEQLARETLLLEEWLQKGFFSDKSGRCGYELEGWITDKQYQPAPLNAQLLKKINDPMVVPELSTFNFEINSQAQATSPDMFRRMQQELSARWEACSGAASGINCQLLHIGILPTLKDNILTMANISPLQRYFALNREILEKRKGAPLVIDIEGPEDHLHLTHTDVMTEAATTSLQIHLQLDPDSAVRFFNAAQILSAPMVAISANSPFLFGKLLWEETRIPLFEQAVSAPAFFDKPGHIVDRVTFGTRYVSHSLLELFQENLKGFPVLLPELCKEDRLNNLRLHNGTIWRWNRPLIGFNDEGVPHFRLEHRVAAAGPSIPDVIANIVFFYGLIHALAKMETAPESQLPFEHARANFYQAARQGLKARIFWIDGHEYELSELITHSLLPLAEKALSELGIDTGDIQNYLGDIIGNRVSTGQTGAQWQKAFFARHNHDLHKLTEQYFLNQQTLKPVYRWEL